MKSPKGSLIIGVLLVALGIGWLLTELKVVPGIDWAWSLGLAAVGILAFILSGFDKVSMVLGPFFLVASIVSLLRQRQSLPGHLELPILITVAGLLLLIARLPVVPLPHWLASSSAGDPKRGP